MNAPIGPQAQEAALLDLFALSEKATAGPWCWSENGNIIPAEYQTDSEIAAVYSERHDDLSPANAEFIIALVNWFRENAATLATPARVVSDAQVEAYCEAVEAHLASLTPKDWEIERFDPKASVRKVARIGLQAALSFHAAEAGQSFPELPEAKLMTALGNEGYTADQMHEYARAALSTLQSGAEGKDGEIEPLGYIKDFDAMFLKEKLSGQATVLVCQEPQNKKSVAIYAMSGAQMKRNDMGELVRKESLADHITDRLRELAPIEYGSCSRLRQDIRMIVGGMKQLYTHDTALQPGQGAG